MVNLVLVAHSRALADALVDLIRQVAGVLDEHLEGGCVADAGRQVGRGERRGEASWSRRPE